MADAHDWSDNLQATSVTAGLGYVRVHKSEAGPVARLANISKSIQCDDASRMVQAVISTPMVDTDGDEVIPAGFDLTYHKSIPTVLYEHDPRTPVGVAENADGHYTVRLAGDRLVAETYFAPTKIGEDLYDLYRNDVLRGWSATFVPLVPGIPLGEFNKSIGRAPMRFTSQKLLEYSATSMPVNMEALTILVEKGRNGNGPFHPVIHKSLAAKVALERTTSVVVPPHALTMPINKPRATTAMDDNNELLPPTATQKHSYDGAQACSDIANHLSKSLREMEHSKGRKNMQRVIGDLQQIAAELKANGDMVGSDLDDKPEEQDAMVEKAVAVELLEDGTIVIQKAAYAPKRWTTKDLAAATAGTTSAPAAPRKSRAERQKEREEAERAQELKQYRDNLAKYPDFFRPAKTA